ncbi:MAG TPA: hypothetical protein VIZ65_14380 [Cellvibrionaceae bacterium]
MTTNEMFQIATLAGYVKIAPALYLSSQTCILEEQKAWLEDDVRKKLDLSSHPFWVTTDDDKSIVGINDESELRQLLAKIESHATE